jgi:hypothetical protein
MGELVSNFGSMLKMDSEKLILGKSENEFTFHKNWKDLYKW